jgi:predicted negative regulator of RcsB-dependent stress response
MIKKIIIFAILAAAGYIGFLVWNNLNEEEKTAVSNKIGDIAAQGKNALQKGADKLTKPAKNAIKEKLMKDEK